MKFQVLFLGTGVSTAIPNIRHVLDCCSACGVCGEATAFGNKNRRNNVSIAVVFGDETGTNHCIMVDAGKTMRDSCIAMFPRHGIQSISALLLTHGHADAILGLDDLRDLQQFERVEVPDPHITSKITLGFRVLSGPLPIYLTAETLNTVQSAFPYLTAPPRYLDAENHVVERRIACIDLKPIEERDSINIHGFPIESFPVYHGGTYVSLGFCFGRNGKFVYISDVKIVPEASMAYLRSLPVIEVLVIDCLDRDGIWSHVGLHEAIDICKVLNPNRVLFTGMSCGLGLHDDVNKELVDMGLCNYSLAFDGMVLDFDE